MAWPVGTRTRALSCWTSARASLRLTSLPSPVGARAVSTSMIELMMNGQHCSSQIRAHTMVASLPGFAAGGAVGPSDQHRTSDTSSSRHTTSRSITKRQRAWFAPDPSVDQLIFQFVRSKVLLSMHDTRRWKSTRSGPGHVPTRGARPACASSSCFSSASLLLPLPLVRPRVPVLSSHSLENVSVDMQLRGHPFRPSGE